MVVSGAFGPGPQPGSPDSVAGSLGALLQNWNGEGWPVMAKAGLGWSRLAWAGQGCLGRLRLAWWSRLAWSGQGWASFVTMYMKCVSSVCV